MMAESTASLESQHHSPKPVPRPRRNRSKSAIQSCNSEQESHDRSLQENTKPERPSVPPRPNFSELKKFATRTHSSTVHNQASPSSPKQRQIPTESQIKSPGSPRSVGSSSANTLIHQRKSEQPQRKRSKSNSESVDSGRSNGTLRQRQAPSNNVSDSGLQGSKSTKSSSAAKISHSKSFSSPEHKRNTNATTSTARANAQQQSPTRPKPPLPANRPSIAPTTSSKGSSVRQNQRPSRPPTLPKTAAALNTSKTAPLSHLYGSTQSLPAVTDGSIKVATTPKYSDDSSESTKLNASLATAGSGRHLKVSPNKEPQRSYRTLPKDYGRKRVTKQSHRLQTASRNTSDTLHVQGKRTPPASTNVGTTTNLRGLEGQNNNSTTVPRKTQPQHSKIPPKRPPPVVKDKPRPAVVAKTPPTPPSVNDNTSNPRYTTFTNRVQQQQQRQQQQRQQLIEEHIYMDPHQTDVSSWPTEGSGAGAEYPYVIMSRADSAHIYTALALDTTDDSEGQFM